MSNCLKVINIDHDILQLYIANIMKRRPNTTLLEWTAILLILASVLALVLQLVSYQNIRSNLQFGMTIAGVPVGGMTLGDAEDTLTRVYATPVELHFQNDVFYLEPAEISFRLETESMLAIADTYRTDTSFWSSYSSEIGCTISCYSAWVSRVQFGHRIFNGNNRYGFTRTNK